MKITALALEAMLAKLSSNTKGFNISVSNAAPGYNVTKPYVIEFPTTLYYPNTRSFIFGKLNPDDVGDYGVADITRMCMYPVDVDNQNIEKPRDFSGVVRCGIDFHIQWKEVGNKINFISLALLTEDALLQVFNLNSVQNWGTGVVYNGDFRFAYGGVSVPDEQASWRQLCTLTMAFEVNSGPS